MLTLSVETLTEVVDGDLVYGPETTVVNGIAIDSRDVEPGAAFVAFVGERADGHHFAEAALENGARALLVTRPPEALVPALESAGRRDVCVVLIKDPARALRDLASYHRNRLTCPVVGITGSTGKTTTKDLLAAVLGRTMRVVATRGNMNNEIGAPLTLMRAGVETEILVLEMAMRGRGQIADLCAMARPTVGLVTNVGETHMEMLGSRDAIAEAKGELVRSIPGDGLVLLNGDDAWSEKLAESSEARVVTYGLGEECDIRVTDLEVDAEGHPTFTLHTGSGEIRPTLGMPGRHNAYNAAAATAVALHVGVDLEDVASGLGEAGLSPMRMEAFTSAGGVTVINDAYNASPSSMRAAVHALLDISVPGRRIAVLGDMAELGSLTELAHFKLGEDVGRARIDVLVTVGEKASRIADGAKAEGMDTERMHRFADAAEAADFVTDLVNAADAVLVKASRAMGLEAVVEALMRP